MTSIAVVVPLAVTSAQLHGSTRDARRTVIVSFAAFVLVSAGAAALLAVARRRHCSLFGILDPPIEMGLPRHQRREVARNIRRGTPSADPTHAAIEREVAVRMVRTSARSRVMLGLFAVLELTLTFTSTTWAVRIFFGASTIFFAATLALNLWLTRRVQIFLALGKDRRA